MKTLEIAIIIFLVGLSLQAKEKDDISDAELDQMLKDPKYASLIGGNAEELLKASPANSSNKKPKKKSLDPLDDLELGSSSSDSPTTTKKHEDKVEDKFNSYDFISKQQARYLIEILKQPVFFNMLPQEAQQIVKVTKDNFQFKMTQDSKIDDFIETNMANTVSSSTFIDTDGQVGRKGVLTIIDPINSNSKFIWCVVNSKTLTFFESQNFLTIVKLFRLSSLVMKDISATPCFLVYNQISQKDGSYLVCGNTTQEKEVWIQTINSAINGSKVNQIAGDLPKNLR